MVNKDLDVEACKTFVCPNIGLIDQACKDKVSQPIIDSTKQLVIEYFKKTYHYPRYSYVKTLFPAFLFIVANLENDDAEQRVVVSYADRHGFSQTTCSDIFSVAEATTRKWIKDILRELDISYYDGRRDYISRNKSGQVMNSKLRSNIDGAQQFPIGYK